MGDMATMVPKEPTVEALAEVWGRLDELLTGLDEASWSAPTPLPGWDVKAVVAHLIGTEAMLQGEPTPDVEIDPVEFQHVRNDMGRINEAWVASMADLRARRGADPLPGPDGPPARRAARTPARRTGTPRGSRRPATTPTGGSCGSGSSTAGSTSRTSATPSASPAARRARAARAALDEMEAALGFVVGKKAAAPAGSRVDVRADRPGGRTIHVEVGDRAKVVDELAGPATVTLTMPVGVFSRLAGRAGGPRGRCAARSTIDGDEDLGERIVANLRLHDLNRPRNRHRGRAGVCA